MLHEKTCISGKRVISNAWIWLSLMLLFLPAAHGIQLGADRADVVQELGRPLSSAERGDREILYYPKNCKVVLIQGKVTECSGQLLTQHQPAPPPPPAAAPVPISAPDISTPKPETPPAPPATAVSTTAAPPIAAAIHPAPVVPVHPLPEPDYESERNSPPSTLLSIGIIFATLIVQFGLTIAALKIAFHYQQMDTLWPGLLSIAAIDVVLQSIFALTLFFQTGEIRLGIAGAGLPGLAMIFAIRKFCFDQRWFRAARTTSAVKFASIVLNLTATKAIESALY